MTNFEMIQQAEFWLDLATTEEEISKWAEILAGLQVAEMLK